MQLGNRCSAGSTRSRLSFWPVWRATSLWRRRSPITVREVGSESGQPDVLAIYAAQIYVIRYEQGRLDEILAVQEQAVEQAPLLEAYSGALALSYCELGEMDKARVILGGLRRRWLRSDPHPSSKTALCYLAEVAARLNEQDAAETPLRAITPLARPAQLHGNLHVRPGRALPRPRRQLPGAP